MNPIRDLESLNAVREAGLAKVKPARPRIAVGMGTCGAGNGAESVFHAFADAIDKRGLDVELVQTGCFGFCAEEPLVNVWVPGQPLLILHRIQQDHVGRVLDGLRRNAIPDAMILCKVERWDHITAALEYGFGYSHVPSWEEVPFYSGQKKVVMRNCGFINPTDIDEFIAIGGYRALYDVLVENAPLAVIERIKKARLRGRGGGGFPTGLKFESLRKANGTQKYLICNADEGDPGAYMNRNELEGDPHSLLEGMAIGGYVTGATQGIIYVRAEYPLAVQRLRTALSQARSYGLIGKNIFGSGFDFDIDLVENAGAFVCGEETALIASLEGLPGRARARPPYPAEDGLWGRPTNINNVETWFNIAPIIAKGPEWFGAIGSEASPGTKVFSLVGKVANTGLVEAPLGTPISKFVFDMGGGASSGRSVKAVQTGGPSGGCIPVDMFDTPADFESLSRVGSILSSGVVVVMDQDHCMVDTARYFVEFMRNESCGKCTPCRVGLDKALRTLTRITKGEGREEDLTELDELARMIRDTSLCGLGQSAPNSILTALRHYRNEFEDHIRVKRCRAGVCQNLAVAPCENSCPIHMNIPRFLELYKENRIEDAFMSVIMDNPLPASTGRVCQHPCENRCRRQGVDEAINMREVHRLIADTVLLSDKFDAMAELVVARRRPPTGKRVAILGAGPSGLTASFYLAMMGHKVEVFDAHKEAGGMLRYAIPAYRLPKNALDQEIELIRRLGVTFDLGSPIGDGSTINELEDQYDAVFLALGTWNETHITLAGSEIPGVYGALAFLEAQSRGEPLELGDRVVVIGGGNAAIDCARTVVRRGAAATVIYRRDRKDMPAIAEEVEAAEEEGVKLVFLATPNRVVAQDGAVKAIELIRTRLGGFDNSGRRRPIDTGEIITEVCDNIILATGESVDTDFSRATGLATKKNGLVTVDRDEITTSREGVFAGGDFVNGASNVTIAMRWGKRAAVSIDKRLTGKSSFDAIMPTFTIDQSPPQPCSARRHHGHFLRTRARSFEEAIIALRPDEAHAEASRCLRCDIRESTASASNR